jgi:transcriptional regulator with XRE-family HTH domain
MTTLGERLAMTRRKRGLTQAEVAEMAGIGRPQLANIEAGRSRPSVDSFAFICRSLGVTMDDIYWHGWHQ